MNRKKLPTGAGVINSPPPHVQRKRKGKRESPPAPPIEKKARGKKTDGVLVEPSVARVRVGCARA